MHSQKWNKKVGIKRKEAILSDIHFLSDTYYNTLVENGRIDHTFIEIRFNWMTSSHMSIASRCPTTSFKLLATFRRIMSKVAKIPYTIWLKAVGEHCIYPAPCVGNRLLVSKRHGVQEKHECFLRSGKALLACTRRHFPWQHFQLRGQISAEEAA